MINKTNAMGAAVFAPNVVVAGNRPAAKFDIAHHLPGRLRLRSRSVGGDARASDEARRHLGQIAGVTSITANPHTGSLLLHYDPDRLTPGKLIEVLETRGYLPAAAAEEGAESGWTGLLASAVTNWMIEALAGRLALALIGALA